MTITAAYQQSASYNADVDRQSLYAGMAGTSSTSSIVPRDGCIPDGVNPLAVTASSGMVLNVNAGQAMIAGYTFSNDAATTVTIGTSGASARTDIVVARVRDQAAGDASTSATIEVVQGTTTAPTRSIILAQIAVGANVVSINSGNITDKRVYTVTSGGAVPIAGAFVTPSLASGLVDGTPVWDSNQNTIGVKVGGAVVQPSAAIPTLQNISASGVEILDNTTTSSIPSASWTALGFAAGTLTSPATSTGTLINVNTVVPGLISTDSRWYILAGSVRFASGAGTGRRGVYAGPSSGGTGTPAIPAETHSAASGGDNLNFSTLLWVPAGITVQLYAYQDSGSAINLTWRRLVMKAL